MKKIELAVLPWGATEAHNFHLPYGTDIYEAEVIAAESARIAWENGAKVIVLPTLPFGVNTGQHDIYLDINLNPSTQLAILADIIEVLNRQQIHKLLIFNSHGGNDFKAMLRELGLKYPKMFLCTSNWFQALSRKEYFEMEGDHADELETSIMMHIKPELILDRKEWGQGDSKRFSIDAFNENWLWAERAWSKVSTDTGVGNPKLSSKEKGERFFKDVTQKIGQMLTDLSALNKDDMYI
ncbi:MAG: creatininase family protein [Cyclobacteriaceae bacterium]